MHDHEVRIVNGKKYTYKYGPLRRLGDKEDCPNCGHLWYWPYPTPDYFNCPNCDIEFHNTNI